MKSVRKTAFSAMGQRQTEAIFWSANTVPAVLMRKLSYISPPHTDSRWNLAAKNVYAPLYNYKFSLIFLRFA